MVSSDALRQRILVARGEIPADLVLKGAKVVNVFSGGVQEKDVAVCQGFIAGVGPEYHGKEEVDLEGRWVIPGLMDGHMHVESTLLLPSHLARGLLPHGTTAIVADPHEIANVMGMDGIRFMLQESSDIPLDIFFMAPSCVPATHMETAGSVLNAEDLSALKAEPRVLGLGEMMNVPGVLTGDGPVLEKIEVFRDKVLDGHCPSLSGYDLQAYLSTGIRSDHETSEGLEGLEKLESGMMLMVREGTTAKNINALLPLVRPANSRRFCLVSDDLHAEDIYEGGHLDVIVKKAIQRGLDPVTAIQMVTLNPAEYFGLRDRGAIAPGFRADLVVLDDLDTVQVSRVYKDGRIAAQNGEVVDFPAKPGTVISPMVSKPLNMAPLGTEDLHIPHPGGQKARVIELIPGQILTRMKREAVKSVDGAVVSNVESDVLKLFVVERHVASGRIGKGLVRGFGLRRGAMASSVAHDSHNVIAVGVTDEEILQAVQAVRTMGGGLCVVCGEEIVAKTPLEIAGLMSTQALETLVNQLRVVKKAAAGLDCRIEEPFMALSFLALPVIPDVKLTDKGLVDVKRFEIVPLFFGE
jgi:adenine deaminase